MCNMQYNITLLINSFSSPLMTNTLYIYKVLYAKPIYQILDEEIKMSRYCYCLSQDNIYIYHKTRNYHNS